MLKINALIFIFFAAVLNAQPPEGYYAAANGLQDEDLKTALYNIIKGHTEYPYSSSSTDVWDILKQSDKDPGNAANVILFYTGWSVNAAQEFNNGIGWNREHVWAKSHGDFGTTPGPGTDAHHLRPTDISVNNARDSRWFDNCTEPYLDGGIETGCFTSSTSYVWQPRNEVKGDVARMIFYMATRYEGENGEPDLEVIDYLPADNYTNEPVHAKLSALLEWNREDPVDDFERNRNEVVYSFQDNRNPFVDHPEYVDLIWGDANLVYDTIFVYDTTHVEVFDTTFIAVTDTLIINAVITATDAPATNATIKVYPNPAKDYLVIENPDYTLMQGYVFRITDQLGATVFITGVDKELYEINLSGWSGYGIYFMHLIDNTGKILDIRKIVLQ